MKRLPLSNKALHKKIGSGLSVVQERILRSEPNCYSHLFYNTQPLLQINSRGPREVVEPLERKKIRMHSRKVF